MSDIPFSMQRFWSIMASVLVLIFLLNIDYTAVTMTLTPISKELGIELNILQWLLSSYVLIWAALVVPCGKLADIYGKKKMFLIGTFVFAAGSLVLGIGDSIEILIAGRIIQGIGGALLSAPAYSIIFSIAPKHMQGFAIGIIASASGIGLSIGPPFSAWIIDSIGWRWIFLINVPLCLAVVSASFFLIPKDIKGETKQHINYLVAFLLTAGLGTFFFGLNQVEIWGIGSPLLWTVLGGGVALLVLFYLLDHRLEKDPQNQTLPRSLIHSKPYTALLYVNFAVCFIFSLTLFGVNLLLQNVKDMSIPETGLFMLWYTLILGVLSPVSGKIADKIGLKTPIWIGTFLMLSGCACYLMITPTAPLGIISAALFLSGAGVSLVFSPLNTMMFRLVPEKDMNTGAGLFTGAMMIGHTFAAIVVSSLLVYWGVHSMPGLIQDMGLSITAEQQDQMVTVLGQAKHDLSTLVAFDSDQLQNAKVILKKLFVSGFHINVILGMLMMSAAALLLYKRLKNVNLSGDTSTEN